MKSHCVSCRKRDRLLEKVAMNSIINIPSKADRQKKKTLGEGASKAERDEAKEQRGANMLS